MKNRRKKYLTFGDLIAAAYSAWGKNEAAEMLRLALKTRLVVFQGHEQFLITTGKGDLHE
jgi:hypothetical protein